MSQPKFTDMHYKIIENYEKGLKDGTVKIMTYIEKDCIFCTKNFMILDSNQFALAFRDNFPVTPLHTLVIPKRHVKSFFELANIEKASCIDLVHKIRDQLLEEDPSITGFNVGFNDGASAGQTIFHSHIHVIPRRNNDISNSSGGIRNIIK